MKFHFIFRFFKSLHIQTLQSIQCRVHHCLIFSRDIERNSKEQPQTDRAALYTQFFFHSIDFIIFFFFAIVKKCIAMVSLLRLHCLPDAFTNAKTVCAW